MFAYLSKKIAIPNGVKLRTLSWNAGEEGWIACGGENGLLKVLKLDAPANGEKGGNSNLSANQTLEGHSGDVQVVTWNETNRKLTTSDQSGLIIVWTLHKGMWLEEMINNRNKSIVRDMRWTPSGEMICIVYEDGAVIVGGVDGNRIWGKDLGISLTLIAWSPDDRLILFCTADCECHIYDSNGNFTSKLPMVAVEGTANNHQIMGIQWYAGSPAPDNTVLALAFDNGKIQMMAHESDDQAIVIDSGLKLGTIEWSRDGMFLAACGTHTNTEDNRGLSLVQFYNPNGQHIRTLRAPGPGVSCLSWEGSGLRIALSVESFIYFANIRPEYQWGYFGNTLVYAFKKKDREDTCVMFWDTKNNEKYLKNISDFCNMRTFGKHCVLTAKGENAKEYNVILCNEIGNPVETRQIEFPAKYTVLTDDCAVVASDTLVYVWHFRPSLDASTVDGKTVEVREKIFHVDQLPSAVGTDDWRMPASSSNDPICNICANNKYLMVARDSGSMSRYALPHLSLEGKHHLRSRPCRMSINCDSSKIALIDTNGVLSFFNFNCTSTSNIDPGISGSHEEYERKDVWDMQWSTDSPDHIAIMEKTRLYVLRGIDPEEPLLSSGYLCEFRDLEIKSVQLDEIMQNPTGPRLESIVCFEARILRDTQSLINTASLSDAYQFVEENPHPRMWRILAETALRQQDFPLADKAFVRCGDYHGIQLVKSIQRLQHPSLQTAEVAFYFQKLNEAEQLYLNMDRPDLAVEMRIKLGDWFRVEKLVTEYSIDDTKLVTAWNHIGDYYADRHKWSKAVQYYAQAKNSEKLVTCFAILEDFEGLEKLTHALPDKSPVLYEIGERFQCFGLCEQALAAFLKAGDPKRAIDCCVLLNRWDHAMELAAQENFPQIEQLLTKHAKKLMESNQLVEAVELNRKGNRNMEAANLLVDLAKKSSEAKVRPLEAKKLYVLAALEVESFRKRVLNQSESLTTIATGASPTTIAQPTTAQTLAGLMTLDAASNQDTGQSFDSAWHSAAAYHFWILAQQQLYNGNPEAAMRLSLHLRDYEDVLPTESIYALLALASYNCKFFGQCSKGFQTRNLKRCALKTSIKNFVNALKAFVKLESLEDIPLDRRQRYADIAMTIFLANPPYDPRQLREAHSHDHLKGRILADLARSKEEICIASGRIIRDAKAIKCKQCKHAMISAEVRDRLSCPLCHSRLSEFQIGEWSPSKDHSHRQWELAAIVE